jgi:hypothetical protein
MSHKGGMTLLTVCLIAVGAHAGTYIQNFESAANGATSLGDGSTIVDTGTGLAQVFYNGASWKALRLTQDGETGAGMTGNFGLADLDSGNAISGFTATFDLLVMTCPCFMYQAK